MWESLQKVHQEGLIVDLRREFIDGSTTRCFVTGLARDLAVLALVNDHCEFDGVSVIRTEDVTFLRWETEVLRSWGRVLAESPSSPEPTGFVDTTDWASAVRTIAGRHEIVTFHRERASDDTCHIGTGVVVHEAAIEAENISIEGTVDGRFAIQVEDLTRVDFGAGYERALGRMVKKSRES